ncbi:hypothetical protein SAMN05192554_12069 [Haloarchaeobius iranensis]|uniref:Uncharacterized protein n=1 Tax=Haloarchaeobius iranensis TaxID=996166 RepID=A0A1G9ZKH9_9EURY|nr:hypothetical protein SAMN05192554_12069 [Haloarchaeobius iranensis]
MLVPVPKFGLLPSQDQSSERDSAETSTLVRSNTASPNQQNPDKIPITQEFTENPQDGTQLLTNGTLVLDYAVLVEDNFTSGNLSESPFEWQTTTRRNGTIEAGESSIRLATENDGDYVGVLSNRTFDFSAHPALELDFVARSTDDASRNVQEFFFLNGSDFNERYFAMYDFGGASPNSNRSDDSCGRDSTSPYNSDQLSYRHFLADVQCWDGFEGAPLDWSESFHGELLLDYQRGELVAYRNGNQVANITRADGQELPPQATYRVWFKNHDKGGPSHMIVGSISVQLVDRYQFEGTYVSPRSTQVRLSIGRMHLSLLKPRQGRISTSHMRRTPPVSGNMWMTSVQFQTPDMSAIGFRSALLNPRTA